MAFDARERGQQDHQDVTIMQKDLALAKSLIQTSSKTKKREHLFQIKSLSDGQLMLHEKLAESGKISQSMKDTTASEQSEAMHELRMKNISLHGFLNNKEKSLDKATLSLDHSESLVIRYMQLTRDVQETVNALQEAPELKDPELATSEVLGQTLTCVANRNHVSEAESAGRIFDKPHDFCTTVSRNCVNPSRRDPLESPKWSNISVHVEEAKPVLLRQCQCILQGSGCHTSSSTDSSKHSYSFSKQHHPSSKPDEISPKKEDNLAGRDPLPTERTCAFNLSAAIFQESA